MQINERKAGIILSYVGQAVKILVTFIYTPIMIRILGKSEYGLYQLVFSVVSYLSLLSLGFASSYLRFYSRYNVKKDEDGVARINGMFLIIFTVMSLICLICGYFLVNNIHVIFGTGLNEQEYKIAKVLMALMIFNMAISFPNSVFNCAITAHEKFIFQKLLIIIQNICSPFLSLPLLIMGYGSIGMVSVTSFITILGVLANIYFCLRKLHMRFIFTNLKLSLLKEMWIFTFFIFLNQIIDQVNWNVDKFLLGRYIGTSAVAVYGIGGQINSLYIQVSSSISNVFMPQVNKIVAESNDNRKLSDLFAKVGRIQFLVIMLVVTGFIFFGKAFIVMWAGSAYKESYLVTLFLIIPITIPLMQNIGIEIQRAKNKHKVRSIVYACISVGNVLISIPLIKIYGSVGAAMGTAISLVLGNILFMNWYYHRCIGIDIINFWKEILKIVPYIIIPCIVGTLIYNFVTIEGVLSFVIWVTIYVIVYGVAVLAYYKTYKRMGICV